MKAVVTSETVGLLLTAIVLIIFFSQVFLRIISLLVEKFSKASAENVARQLSGLITTSGASVYRVRIAYIPTREVSYRVTIHDRVLRVVPKLKVEYAEKASSTQPLAVELGSYEKSDVNYFIIEKNFAGVSRYEFRAEKK